MPVTAGGALPLSPPEAEAAGWVLSRPDVAEGELRAAHPGLTVTLVPMSTRGDEVLELAAANLLRRR